MSINLDYYNIFHIIQEIKLFPNSGLQNIVVGRFCDSSEHLHLLIKGMAEARALFVSRSAGRPLSDNETGVILSSYRRILSCRFIRSQESCLLARLGHMDDGARQAAGRRRLRMREEEMARHEAAAYHTAYIRGRGVYRAGQLPRGHGRWITKKNIQWNYEYIRTTLFSFCNKLLVCEDCVNVSLTCADCF